MPETSSKSIQDSTEKTKLPASTKKIFIFGSHIYSFSRKVYAKSPNFTVLASTDNENFATGSQNGEIRLFKEVGQNAKTLFPGLGGICSLQI